MDTMRIPRIASLLVLSTSLACGSVASPARDAVDGTTNDDAVGAAGGGSGADAHLDVEATGFDALDPACRQATVSLGAAEAFAVLGASTVTSTGLTSIVGDVGVSPGTAITGFPPGTVVGSRHASDAAAAAGAAAVGPAFDGVAARSLCVTTVAGNLGGKTFRPGLYRSTSSLEISSGDLTLDAGGDAEAVFIFQTASTLTVTAGRQVTLSGGAKAGNVFWQVGSSATFGTTAAFQGTVMAKQSITLKTGATLRGRLLARNAAVTLEANTITLPTP